MLATTAMYMTVTFIFQAVNISVTQALTILPAVSVLHTQHARSLTSEHATYMQRLFNSYMLFYQINS